jgi:hypothetical protein
MDMTNTKKRLDTKLEAEAAEFLVLGHLLLEKITAFKAYMNYPGYDLIATNAEQETSAKIQVKSRYRTDWDGFIIGNLDCHFVVFVALNRGFVRPKRDGDAGIRSRDFYVLPIEYVKSVRDPKNAWGKINRSRLSEIEQFIDNWSAISDFLRVKNEP